MEPDKRLDDKEAPRLGPCLSGFPAYRPGIPVEVQYDTGQKALVPVPFTMPLNVFTMATMNSVDKSVAPLDAALRRRFHLLNLDPDLADMAERMGLAGWKPGVGLVLPDPITGGKDLRRLALSAVAVHERRHR